MTKYGFTIEEIKYCKTINSISRAEKYCKMGKSYKIMNVLQDKKIQCHKVEKALQNQKSVTRTRNFTSIELKYLKVY